MIHPKCGNNLITAVRGRYPAALTLTILLILLSACATQPAPPPLELSWGEHRARIQALQHWNAEGKLALRTEQGSESASFDWRQEGEQTRLQLQGPLGVNATTLISDGRQLEFRQGEERRLWDISNPTTIAEETGWYLPLDALPHWLRGLPAPQLDIEALQLEHQRLRSLSQGGWTIHYDDYGAFETFDLPTRLEIRQGDRRARVIIRTWRLRSGS